MIQFEYDLCPVCSQFVKDCICSRSECPNCKHDDKFIDGYCYDCGYNVRHM